MARILGGGMFGEMRGKLGSLVFARNRGGAYSRAYAKPIDPRTIAQLAARSKFGSAASNYHSLDPTAKAMWNQFANNVFNPKTGTMGVPSGINAFVALNNVVNNVKNFTPSINWISGGTTLTFADEYSFENIGYPPTNSLQSNFANDSGGYNPFTFAAFAITGGNLNGGVLKQEFALNLKIQGGGIGPIGNIDRFEDAGGNKFGFKIFASNPVRQPGMFINNPYLIDCGSILGGVLGDPLANEGNIGLTATIEFNESNYASLPVAGDWVQFSIFQVGSTGQLLKIGTQFAQITYSI